MHAVKLLIFLQYNSEMKQWKPDDDNGTHLIEFKAGDSITLDIPTNPPLEVDAKWRIMPRSSNQVSCQK